MLLTVIKDDCYFGGVYIGLLTQCKICFTLGLLANYFLWNQLAFPSKVTWMCYKVNWFVDYKFILFDLNYKIINESFAFSFG